jgi:hypothetical protein
LKITDSEGKPSVWHHWWDKAVTPSSGDDSPPLDNVEEWEANEEKRRPRIAVRLIYYPTSASDE